MKIVKQSWKIETPEVSISRMPHVIERYGRVCYKSEKHITPYSADKFVRTLIKKGHTSVLEHCNITVRFITDRGVTHELVRHRHTAISQESTRYCNYGNKELEFVDPVDMPEHLLSFWKNSCAICEKSYHVMIAEGAAPQFARSVLNNSLKTEIVLTASIREWRSIFQLRCSKSAHPQIRDLMITLKDRLTEIAPCFFDDIGEEDD